MESIFDDVEKGPPIEVFALNKAFLEDSNPNKVNLGVGGKLFIYLLIYYVIIYYHRLAYLSIDKHLINKCC